MTKFWPIIVLKNTKKYVQIVKPYYFSIILIINTCFHKNEQQLYIMKDKRSFDFSQVCWFWKIVFRLRVKTDGVHSWENIWKLLHQIIQISSLEFLINFRLYISTAQPSARGHYFARQGFFKCPPRLSKQ